MCFLAHFKLRECFSRYFLSGTVKICFSLLFSDESPSGQIHTGGNLYSPLSKLEFTFSNVCHMPCHALPENWKSVCGFVDLDAGVPGIPVPRAWCPVSRCRILCRCRNPRCPGVCRSVRPPRLMPVFLPRVCPAFAEPFSVPLGPSLRPNLLFAVHALKKGPTHRC